MAPAVCAKVHIYVQVCMLRKKEEEKKHAKSPVELTPNRRHNSKQNPGFHRNLLKITAMIKSTRIVMMEIVITRFVAMLRAIPLKVLTLRST